MTHCAMSRDPQRNGAARRRAPAIWRTAMLAPPASPGVVLTVTGPGATNVLTAVGGAYNDSSPLLVISSQVPRTYLGKGLGYLRDARPARRLRDVTDWTAQVAEARMGPTIDAAMATSARAGPRPPILRFPSTSWTTRRDLPSVHVSPAEALPAALDEMRCSRRGALGRG